MLARALAWAERRGPGPLAGLAQVTDTRRRPRIPAGRVAQSLFVMACARVGSLNALEQTAGSRRWRELLGGPLASADTLGRVAAGIDPATLRDILVQFYRELKRTKALPAPAHGLTGLVLDGHELTASYCRQCPGGLTRRVTTASGEREQHYHRYVAASLVGADFHLFLDLEEQRPDEDEVAAALRLLHRIHARLPRAYDVVLTDAFYAQAPFFQAVVALGKDVLAVLKQEARALYQDVMGLVTATAPTSFARRGGRTHVQAWDFPALTTWPSVGQPVRVVRTVETTAVRRQKTRAVETVRAEWMWVTTLAPARARTAAVVELGHARWDIENQGFNAAVNEWHLDHVYRHDPVAMVVLQLVTLLAMNVMTFFYRRNLKPALRRRVSLRHVARQVAAEIYRALPPGLPESVPG